jgi:hypothetical protein
MKPCFTLSTAESIEAPAPTFEQIQSELKRLPDLEDDDYLILERADASSHGISASYLQTRPDRSPEYEGVFLVEFRDGVVGRHCESHVEAGAPLLALFASYLACDGAWREMTAWNDISHQFDDLRAAIK